MLQAVSLTPCRSLTSRLHYGYPITEETIIIDSDSWTVPLMQSEDYLTVRLEATFLADEFLGYLFSKKKGHALLNDP